MAAMKLEEQTRQLARLRYRIFEERYGDPRHTTLVDATNDLTEAAELVVERQRKKMFPSTRYWIGDGTIFNCPELAVGDA